MRAALAALACAAALLAGCTAPTPAPDDPLTGAWRLVSMHLIAPAAVRTRIAINAATATGGRHGRTDKEIEAGITPEQCAEVIERAIARNLELVVIGGGLGRLAVTVNRLWPGLYSKLLRHRGLE